MLNDGTDLDNKLVRAALWAKADASAGTYPILYVGSTGFTCKGDEVQDLIDADMIQEVCSGMLQSGDGDGDTALLVLMPVWSGAQVLVVVLVVGRRQRRLLRKEGRSGRREGGRGGAALLPAHTRQSDTTLGGQARLLRRSQRRGEALMRASPFTSSCRSGSARSISAAGGCYAWRW